jgi:hypothetical protein
LHFSLEATLPKDNHKTSKYMFIKKNSFIAAAALALVLMVSDGYAEITPGADYMPNIHGKSLTTPVGWGAAYGMVFAGIGGTGRTTYYTKSRKLYDKTKDGSAIMGVGIGDPVKLVGVQASIFSHDMSKWDIYALNLHVHRYLGASRSVAVGLQNLMLAGDGADTEKSFYIVYSQGVNSELFTNDETGTTKLHYSIGAGSGQFANKNIWDIVTKKGRHGTYVFGNVAYEVFDEMNAITEWNGMNLNVGVSKAFLITPSIPLVITLGVGDITAYSGDGMRLIGGAGIGIML